MRVCLYLGILWVGTCDKRQERDQQFANNHSWATRKYYLPEGSSFEIECLVTVNGNSIKWFKDDFLVRYDKLLRIEHLHRNDTGHYHCAVTNKYGTILSGSVQLTVLYIDGFLKQEDQSIVVSPNSPFLIAPPPLIASQTSYRFLEWAWFCGSDKIEMNDSHYITADGTLVVIDAINHCSSYKAVVSYAGIRYESSKILLSEGVVEPHLFGRTIIFGPTNFTYSEGDNTTLLYDCVPTRSAHVQWFLDDKSIESGQGVIYKHRERRLELLPEYLSSLSGSSKVSCTVRLTGSEGSETAAAILTYLKMPAIVRGTDTREISKEIGSSAYLHCQATGFPSPSIRWFFNGLLLEHSGTDFRLDHLSDKHFGYYQCEAFNIAGNDMETVWFRRKDKNEETTENALKDGVVPTIVESSSDVVADIGEEVSLICRANGKPFPTISWKHNGSALSSSDNYIIGENNLTLRLVSETMFGDYTCLAYNNISTDERTVYVRTAGLKLIEYGPSNQSILIGSNVLMPCKKTVKLKNNDGVKTTWSWNEQTIPILGDPVRRLVIAADGSLSIKQVGPDNIGLYTCTVTFGKQRESISAMLKIIEKPSMPQLVIAELVNNASPAKVRVSWRQGFDGNSVLIKHYIEMRSVGPTELWSDWETAVENVPYELCCTSVIDNLKPSLTYEFRVIAVNRHGPSKPSLPSNNITVPRQPPAAAPRSVAASARSWSSVMVQWQPPPSEQWNGDIMGYIIRYRLANYASLPWLEKKVSNGHVRNAPLEHLITWREYELQVAAYNDRGMGVFSKPIYVTTLEGVPTQAPQNLEVDILNSTAVRVSFAPPDQQMIPGVNQGYKIEFWKGSAVPMSLFRQVRVLPYGQMIIEVINGLEKFGHYNVTVLCFTSPGDGPRSDPVEIITMEDTPGSIENLRFDAADFSTVSVAWDEPAEPNGVITKYVIRFWAESDPENKEIINVPALECSYTKTDLNASTSYAVDVQAFTKAGPGPRIGGRFESGVPPELPSEPKDLVISDIEARSVRLMFVPGFDGHTMIRRWIVEAKVGTSSSFVEVFTLRAPRAHSFKVEGLRPYTKYQLRLIAENVKGLSLPSDPTQQFETKQATPESAPEHLFAEPGSSSSISLIWSPLQNMFWNGEPRGYLILYRVDLTSVSSSWNEIRTANVKSGEFTLVDLRPFTKYEIKMVAENVVGSSKPTKSVFATTYEDTPSVAPTDVHVLVSDRRQVIVSWHRLQPNSSNGMIVGYQVRLIPEESQPRRESRKVVDVASAFTYNVTVDELAPFTSYLIYVSAYTIVGHGPDAEAVSLQTPEDVPGEPSDVFFSHVSENEVRLKWMMPNEPNGRIRHYEVSYWKGDAVKDSTKVQLPYNVHGFSAAGLAPNVRYQFGVMAETSVGWGPQTVVSVLTTSERIPPPIAPVPRLNAARPQSSRELFIIWDDPALQNEDDVSPVRFAVVEYQRLDEEWEQLFGSIPAKKHEATLAGLNPNSVYRARIYLKNDFARSSWSVESAWFKTLSDAPNQAPDTVLVRPFESSSVMITWYPPPKSGWNSDVVVYRIQYRVYPSNDPFKTEDIYGGSSDQLKMQHVLRNLSSFRHFIIRIQTTNDYGSSPPSRPVFVYVGYAIPRGKVKNATAEAISPNSILVMWDHCPSSEDDVITGFKVRYALVMAATNYEGNVDDTVIVENNSVIISNLRTYTEYQIMISAYNRAGEGEMTVVRVLTLEDRPGPVENLRFTDILLDSVNVSWEPPQQPNGRIQGYIVNYRTYKLKEEFKKEIQEKTSLTYLLAGSLEENVTYFISVRAETSAGYGMEVTGNVTTGANPGSPESPSKPRLIPGQTFVSLEWHDGNPGAFPMKGHIIQAKRIADLKEKDVINRSKRRLLELSVRGRYGWYTISTISGMEPHYELSYHQLEPSSVYTFRVFAFNSVGVGHASPESDHLHVPAFLPDEPFYTKWWFIVMVAMVSAIVVIVVTASLCITGSQYKYKRRSSVDSLRLTDGDIAGYDLRNKRRDFGTRGDVPLHSNTDISWTSDSTKPPTFGSNIEDSSSGICTNMYGVLSTDHVLQNAACGARHVADLEKPSASKNGGTPDALLTDFSLNGQTSEESGQQLPEGDIAQHYDQNDVYLDTWRRARAEALYEIGRENLTRPNTPSSMSLNVHTSKNVRNNLDPSNGISSFV